jgi:hypothetical protein
MVFCRSGGLVGYMPQIRRLLFLDSIFPADTGFHTRARVFYGGTCVNPFYAGSAVRMDGSEKALKGETSSPFLAKKSICFLGVNQNNFTADLRKKRGPDV